MLTSYAQNFEDVLLWRALGHIKNGCYLDIGAQDPVIDSVSLVFYEKGWRGVHVEPTPAYAEALRVARPDEPVLQAAIGMSGAVMPLFEIAATGLSTGDASIADIHTKSGFPSREIDVPCLRLGALLDHYSQRAIHWMKIDVEGMEADVLESWAPSQVRPWIVLVEATAPMSQRKTHCAWEHLIEALGYRFASFDGLNRYYVSSEHIELLDSLLTPANVFDDFTLAGSNSFSSKLNAELRSARSTIEDLTAKQTELASRIALTEEHANEREADVQANLNEALALVEATRLASADEVEAARRATEVAGEMARIEAVNLENELLKRQAAHLEDMARASEAAHAAVRDQMEKRLERERDIGVQIDLLHEREAADRAQVRYEIVVLRSALEELANIVCDLRDTVGKNAGRRRSGLLQSFGNAGPRGVTGHVGHHAPNRVSAPSVESLLAHPSFSAPSPLTAQGRSLDGTRASPAANVKELLDLYDEQFVTTAYATLLRRSADRGGLDNYLAQVRAGRSKAEILIELACSAEGREVNARLPGLDHLIAAPAPRPPSLVARLIRRFAGHSHAPLLAAMRSLENTVFRAAALSRSHAEQLVTSQNSHAPGSTHDSGAAPLGPTVANAMELPTQAHKILLELQLALAAQGRGAAQR